MWDILIGIVIGAVVVGVVVIYCFNKAAGPIIDAIEKLPRRR